MASLFLNHYYIFYSTTIQPREQYPKFLCYAIVSFILSMLYRASARLAGLSKAGGEKVEKSKTINTSFQQTCHN